MHLAYSRRKYTSTQSLVAPSSCGDQLFLREEINFCLAESRRRIGEVRQYTGRCEHNDTQRGDEVNLSGAQLQMYFSKKINYYFEQLEYIGLISYK